MDTDFRYEEYYECEYDYNGLFGEVFNNALPRGKNILVECISNKYINNGPRFKLTVGKRYIATDRTHSRHIAHFTIVNDDGRTKMYNTHLFKVITNEEEVQMNKVVNRSVISLAFQIGDKIDITYTRNDGLPNRVLIDGFKQMVGEKEVSYRCLMESTGDFMSWIGEKWLIDHMSAKASPIYDLPIIKTMYETGWRFCGNDSKVANTAKAMPLKNHSQIAHIRLMQAYYPDGNPIPNQTGLWIMYKNPILGADNNPIQGNKRNKSMKSDPLKITDIK